MPRGDACRDAPFDLAIRRGWDRANSLGAWARAGRGWLRTAPGDSGAGRRRSVSPRGHWMVGEALEKR